MTKRRTTKLSRSSSPAALKRDVLELNKTAKAVLAIQADNLRAFIETKPEQTESEQNIVETIIRDIGYYNEQIQDVEKTHGKLDDPKQDRLAVSLDIGGQYVTIIDNAQHTITPLIANLSDVAEAHIDELNKNVIGATP